MKYKFREEQNTEIKAARRANKDKRVERRLKVLELRSEGKSQREIVEKTGFHRSYVCSLIKRYFEEGLQSVNESHYVGNRRNIKFCVKEDPIRQRMACKASGIWDFLFIAVLPRAETVCAPKA